MLLDTLMVPNKNKDGYRMDLFQRVQTLGDKATDRSRLAYKLFQYLDGRAVYSLENLKTLLDEARKEFGIPCPTPP